MSSVPAPLADYPYVHWEEVHFRDLDALGHVNNVVYAGWLESARIHYYLDLMQVPLTEMGLILAELTISYRAPAYFGERLAVGVRVSSLGTKSFVMDYLIVREGDERVIASAKTVLVCYDYRQGVTVPVSEEFRRRVGAQ
ncbi:MAG TPA: thioesterase family protein [Chloroflexaceae bacterium]|nr:thioesterase family protein [Chloroflexaceae bacterium]